MLGGMMEKCSHGIPMFEPGARCIDCEIYWERMSIDRAKETLAKAKKQLAALQAEKKGKKT